MRLGRCANNMTLTANFYVLLTPSFGSGARGLRFGLWRRFPWWLASPYGSSPRPPLAKIFLPWRARLLRRFGCHDIYCDRNYMDTFDVFCRQRHIQYQIQIDNMFYPRVKKNGSARNEGRKRSGHHLRSTEGAYHSIPLRPRPAIDCSSSRDETPLPSVLG